MSNLGSGGEAKASSADRADTVPTGTTGEIRASNAPSEPSMDAYGETTQNSGRIPSVSGEVTETSTRTGDRAIPSGYGSSGGMVDEGEGI